MSRGTLVLDSVTLELEAVAVTQIGFHVRFFILEFGRTRTATATSALTLVLARPGAQRPERGLAQQSRLVQALSAAIVAAGEVASAGWDSIEGLVPKSVSCQVSFGVTREGNQGLNVAAMSLTAGAGRVSSQQSVQTIKMTFTPKKQEVKAPAP
ncbi:MAG: hypothetical protein HY825_00550 [Acidobacteria bacterium]|nr:hypothetical protein [Acidobacteriota bacterium]